MTRDSEPFRRWQGSGRGHRRHGGGDAVRRPSDSRPRVRLLSHAPEAAVATWSRSSWLTRKLVVARSAVLSRRRGRSSVVMSWGWCPSVGLSCWVDPAAPTFASYARVVHAQCSTRPFHRRQTSLPLGNSARHTRRVRRDRLLRGGRTPQHGLRSHYHHLAISQLAAAATSQQAGGAAPVFY